MNKKVLLSSIFLSVCACEFDAGTSDLDPGSDSPVAGLTAGAPVTLTAGSDLGPGEPLLTPTPVDQVDDLPGDYYRPFALPGQISLLTLGRLEVGNDGDYDLLRSCGLPTCIPEVGIYHATPENPAVGYAFIQLFVGASAFPTDTYIIDAIWRDADGAVAALQLRRLLPAGVIGAPFLMYAQWWTVAADASDAPDPIVSLANELTAAELIEHGELEPEIAGAIVDRRRTDGLFATAEEVGDAAAGVAYADSGLCAYYRGLQEYYAIRALQCAYSICYPLSPWYGYWAEYYRRRADAVCGDGE